MKGILLVLLVLLTACTTNNSTTEEVWNEIVLLDEKHGTTFKEEMVNKMILTSEQISLYLEDLELLRAEFKSDDLKVNKHITWLIDTRQKMLEAQLAFLNGWVGIGEAGRVQDGFQCSEFESIKAETQFLEQAYIFGQESMKILDSLMSEDLMMRELIGIEDNKPAIYNSDYVGIYVHIRNNFVAMNKFCDQKIPLEIKIRDSEVEE